MTEPPKSRRKPAKPDLPRNVTAEQAAEIIERHFERGETLLDITHDLLNPTATRQSLAVEKVVAIERGRRQQPEPPPIAPEDMPSNMRQRYEVALRKARRELREEITVEISEAYQGMLDRYRERLADADRIIASHKGVISRDAFRKIKACLHPDHNTFTFAAEALQTFSELEKVLVKSTSPVSGPPLPATIAELMARRRQYRR